MNLTYAKCETILNTLPIGYYTGRRVKTSLDRNEETSFYSPIEDTIVISYPIIAERLSKLPDTADDEEAIRSMLYHEVSHAILTPLVLAPSEINNIFEDERIETVLRNYYHNVNFRKQILDLHGGHAPKATNAKQAFYNAVRFGLGTGKVQKEINRMLKKYSEINRFTERYNRMGKGAVNYENDIEDLYYMISKEFESEPESFNEPEGQEGESKQMDSLDNKSDKGNGEGNTGNEETAQLQDMPSKIGDKERGILVDIETIKRMVGACVSNEPHLQEEDMQRLAEFQKTVETIISNFNKKNSGGSGINAYSGVFNPRAVARKDYRFFERSMSTQGNNRFGSCHLNLIIDCSGSFFPNVDLTNAILSTLSEVERKNKNFSMDVVFINHTIKICRNVRQRHMKAWGGNEIPSNIKEILLKLQKPQTCNYNIILFDGDAMCNNNEKKIGEKTQLFRAFDMKQTTLITDPENKPYLGKGFTSTKVVITTNYTQELVNNITRALMVAFG